MSDTKEFEQELRDIFKLFYDDPPTTFETIETSRSDTDFREVAISRLSSGEMAVIKLSDNTFTFPDKIKMWQRTVKEYHRLGYYCPEIFPDKNGGFPTVRYKGHNCVAYAEEYSPYRPAEYRSENSSDMDIVPKEKYEKDAWIMTAKIASEYFSYTEYPSGYCLFETFCPSDKTDEVLEDAMEWHKNAQTLPEELQPQIERIWQLWWENRNALEPLYKTMPTSVFQADLNSTNILLNEDGKFVGIYDFNLCGRDVFLNYLFRETFTTDFEAELNAILGRLKLVSPHYRFSDIEKQVAPMLYRCLKPIRKYYMLEDLKNDMPALKKHLDEIEHYLTADIDFSSCMNA